MRGRGTKVLVLSEITSQASMLSILPSNLHKKALLLVRHHRRLRGLHILACHLSRSSPRQHHRAPALRTTLELRSQQHTHVDLDRAQDDVVLDLLDTRKLDILQHRQDHPSHRQKHKDDTQHENRSDDPVPAVIAREPHTPDRSRIDIDQDLREGNDVARQTEPDRERQERHVDFLEPFRDALGHGVLAGAIRVGIGVWIALGDPPAEERDEDDHEDADVDVRDDVASVVGEAVVVGARGGVAVCAGVGEFEGACGEGGWLDIAHNTQQ